MKCAWDKKEVRELKDALANSGYVLNRTNGSHNIYKHNVTGQTIVVNKDLNKMVAQRLKKELGI